MRACDDDSQEAIGKDPSGAPQQSGAPCYARIRMDALVHRRKERSGTPNLGDSEDDRVRPVSETCTPDAPGCERVRPLYRDVGCVQLEVRNRKRAGAGLLASPARYLYLEQSRIVGPVSPRNRHEPDVCWHDCHAAVA